MHVLNCFNISFDIFWHFPTWKLNSTSNPWLSFERKNTRFHVEGQWYIAVQSISLMWTAKMLHTSNKESRVRLLHRRSESLRDMRCNTFEARFLDVSMNKIPPIHTTYGTEHLASKWSEIWSVACLQYHQGHRNAHHSGVPTRGKKHANNPRPSMVYLPTLTHIKTHKMTQLCR